MLCAENGLSLCAQKERITDLFLFMAAFNNKAHAVYMIDPWEFVHLYCIKEGLPSAVGWIIKRFLSFICSVWSAKRAICKKKKKLHVCILHIQNICLTWLRIRTLPRILACWTVVILNIFLKTQKLWTNIKQLYLNQNTWTCVW